MSTGLRFPPTKGLTNYLKPAALHDCSF